MQTAARRRRQPLQARQLKRTLRPVVAEDTAKASIAVRARPATERSAVLRSGRTVMK